MIVNLIEKVYSFLWGDLLHIPLPGGNSLGISLLIILLIPTGIYFTIRTRFLPLRLFPDMVKALVEKKEHESSLSSFQALIVSTATRVGMGNLAGVVAAVSVGGAGAVFWMWVTALIGSSTAFVEATLAQLFKEKDPLYGGYRGGPAYYIHAFVEEKQGRKRKKVLISTLFAVSGLICWCGISQVVSNSVVSSFKNAFSRSSDGSNLFCYHSGYYRDEHRESSGSIFQNLPGSFWVTSGGSRGIWSCSYEWCQERTFFQRSRFRFCSMCGSGSRVQQPCQSGSGTGFGSFY